MYLGTWQLDDLLTFPVNTHSSSTGAAADADAVPSYRVYEDETGTAILTGSMAKLDDANTVGFYSEQITLSAANGFEVGKSYTIYVSAIVGGVTGTLSRTFQVEVALATVTALAAVQADVDDIQARLPASLVSGRIDASVGAVVDNAITAAAIAADAITAAKVAADAVSEIQSGLATAASIVTLQTSVDDLPTNAELAISQAGADDATLAAIAALNNLSAAQVNAEVDTALADYDGPTFAELDARTDAIDAALVTIAAFLDTEIAAILADTSELQVDWANGGRLDLLIDAIKAKTDGLPPDPADASVIAAATTAIAGYIDTEVASILAAVDTEIATLVTNVAAILADTGTDGVVLSTATQQAIADVLLGRSVANVEASAGVHTLASLVLAAFESAIAGTVWTIKRTDGTTTFATRAVTLDAGADPITGVT